MNLCSLMMPFKYTTPLTTFYNIRKAAGKLDEGCRYRMVIITCLISKGKKQIHPERHLFPMDLTHIAVTPVFQS